MKIYGTLVELGMEAGDEASIARIAYGDGRDVTLHNLSNEQVRALAPLFMEQVVITVDASA